MKKFLSDNAAFLVPFVIVFSVLALAVGVCPKADLHLALNSFHTTFGDVFFKYFTKIAEIIPYLIIAGLLFYKLGIAVFVLVGQLGAGLLTQILKHIFAEARPKVFFATYFPDIQLPVVEGVHLHSSMSFPSGHTTAFFALFFALALVTKNKYLKFLYFLLATLGGFSRIYLSQHFPIDVLFGAIIGVGITAIFYFTKFPLKQSWSDKTIYRLRKSN